MSSVPSPSPTLAVAPTLQLRPAARQAAVVAAVVVAATIASAVVGLLVPTLAPSGSPTPTLQGTVGEALSIFINNARVLAVPLGLTAVGWTVGRTRIVGDAVVAGLAAASVVPVGLAIGDHGRELAPYLPHLPIEWAALSVAVAAWVAHRGRAATPRTLVPYVLATVVLVALAAAVETAAIPHA